MSDIKENNSEFKKIYVPPSLRKNKKLGINSRCNPDLESRWNDDQDFNHKLNREIPIRTPQNIGGRWKNFEESNSHSPKNIENEQIGGKWKSNNDTFDDDRSHSKNYNNRRDVNYHRNNYHRNNQRSNTNSNYNSFGKSRFSEKNEIMEKNDEVDSKHEIDVVGKKFIMTNKLNIHNKKEIVNDTSKSNLNVIKQKKMETLDPISQDEKKQLLKYLENMDSSDDEENENE